MQTNKNETMSKREGINTTNRGHTSQSNEQRKETQIAIKMCK